MSVASNIKAIMFEYDITQETLAKICGVSQASVSYWISGVRKPSSMSVKAICKYFQLEPYQVLSEKRGMANKIFGNSEADERLDILEQRFSRLSDKNKDLVLTLVERLGNE